MLKISAACRWRAWAALGACLLLASACAPTNASVRPTTSAVSAERVDPALPRAGALSTVDDPDAVTVASTIGKVTVYSDRALVARQGAVELTTAPLVFAFRQLPGWVDEGSVRAATSAGRILDVRVVRGYLARATEPRYREAEAAARDLSSRLLALEDEVKVLDAQAKQVEDIKAFSLDELKKDVASGRPPSPKVGSVGVGTYSAVVDFIAKKLREIAQGRRDVQAQRDRLRPEADANKKLLDELKALTQLEETQVLVTLQSSAPTKAQLELSYLLPGATWESVHEVRTTGADEPSVEVTSYAVVAQATGEDWDRADLTFSTQSSTTAVRIPELAALTLGDTRVATRAIEIETRSASFRRAEAAFKGQNRLWNKRVQSATVSGNFEESYQTNFESLELTQGKTVRIFQSLQERGTTTQFKALTGARVRADGRAVRVPIGRADLKAKQAIVAVPEQSLNAAQTLQLRNDSGQSLLPGQVALYRAGAFLGMTSLDFVADGEGFALFSSVADQLKISRVLDKKHSALVRKQRTQMQLAFVVTVENLSNKPVALQLADRVPVSEDRDIVISGVKIGPDARPDSQGIVRWSMTLKPLEKRTFEVQYQIEYPPTLVLEMKRSRDEEAAPDLAAPSPLSPAPSRAYDLKREIRRMEESF